MQADNREQIGRYKIQEAISSGTECHVELVNYRKDGKQITVNADGADFVFNPSYKLNTLPALKYYIDKNHHLPEIPSAAEMKKDGLNLGENQVKLLQKVEELTLYLIEKDKQLQEQAEAIQQEVDQLKQQQ